MLGGLLGVTAAAVPLRREDCTSCGGPHGRLLVAGSRPGGRRPGSCRSLTRGTSDMQGRGTARTSTPAPCSGAVRFASIASRSTRLSCGQPAPPASSTSRRISPTRCVSVGRALSSSPDTAIVSYPRQPDPADMRFPVRVWAEQTSTWSHRGSCSCLNALPGQPLNLRGDGAKSPVPAPPRVQVWRLQRRSAEYLVASCCGVDLYQEASDPSLQNRAAWPSGRCVGSPYEHHAWRDQRRSGTPRRLGA